MTRLMTLGCLLAGALMLGALPARAEFMRDDMLTFDSERASERSGARASARQATRQRASRATRAVERGARANRSVQRSARTIQRTARTSTRARTRTAVRSRAPSGFDGFPSLSGGAYQSGIASYYWQGQRVASGGRFNPSAMTAAHRTLPFGTRVRVTSHSTGRSVVVTINDRGPFIRGRIIDLSRGAAGVIGMTGAGLARVSIAVLGR